MSQVIEKLRSLDRKERFAVLREALGFHRDWPDLDYGFRKRLQKCIRVRIPERVFLAMDYHMDWIQLALCLPEASEIEPETPFKNPGLENINKNQQDIDLVVAFETKDGAATHLVLIEAKAYLGWNNHQLNCKAKRLGEIFGSDGKRHETVQPHFVLMTNRVSEEIHTHGWPEWTRDGGQPLWLEYCLPQRYEVRRWSKKNGRQSREGSHLLLRPVPRERQLNRRRGVVPQSDCRR